MDTKASPDSPITLPRRPAPQLQLETVMQTADGKQIKNKPLPISPTDIIKPRFVGYAAPLPSAEARARLEGFSPPCLNLVEFAKKQLAGPRGRWSATVVLVYQPDRAPLISELARALAAALFEDPDALERYDCRDPHTTGDFLFGTPPGYRGYYDGAAVGNRLVMRPESLFLVENFEYADSKTISCLNSIWKGDWDQYGEKLMTRGGGDWRTITVSSAAFLLTTTRGWNRLEAGSVSVRDAMAASLQSSRSDIDWSREARAILCPSRTVAWV